MKRGYTKKEARRRRTKFMVLASMGDFVGTVVGFFVILACVVLLTTLLTWLKGDIVQVFDSLHMDPYDLTVDSLDVHAVSGLGPRASRSPGGGLSLLESSHDWSWRGAGCVGISFSSSHGNCERQFVLRE